MDAAEQIPRISFEEYLKLEQLNSSKHEWLNGLVYMMAGGTFEHGRLVDNVLVALRARLEKRPCQPYSGNFLVRTPSGLGAYPDVMVFCGEILGDAADPKRAATNPTLIVEVLSDSTEEYDRGEKFENYKSLPSLQHYLLVHQKEPKLELFARKEDWSSFIATSGEPIEIASIGITLSVDELYTPPRQL
jgi:Uma2 family endonuclease